VSRNLSATLIPYFGPMKSTRTDQTDQIEKPMCSERMENARLRRATTRPVATQNASSSGRQSEIHPPPRRGCGPASVASVTVETGVTGVLVMFTALAWWTVRSLQSG